MNASEVPRSGWARWRALSGVERLSLVLSALIGVGFIVGSVLEGPGNVFTFVVGALFIGLTVWRWITWTRASAPGPRSTD
ncbi:hypothetical protein ACO229_06695 [Promicromonospora sp. MS192]|uniref:hypothetical protein n=1 Tax=Promicromonospora sp. MS192 TaxID=3412684 RepID=UPI003C2C69DC